MEAWGIAVLILIAIGVHQAAMERRLGRIELQLRALLLHFGAGPAEKAVASQRIKDLAKDPSRKIEAIKALREETGLGLKEAKDIVEKLAIGVDSPDV